jgi:hypothetical protein
LVTARLATGRVLDFAGTDDEYTNWLSELRSETLIDLDVHELSDAEVDAFDPIMDSPGTSPEEDYA